MCRPLGESHEEACPGGHIGPPLRDGGAFRTNGYWCRTTPFPAGRDGARPLPGESEQCGLRRGEVTPPYGSTNGPMWASAPTDRRGSYIDHLGQRRRAERLWRGWEERGGIGAEITPKGASNAGQSLSQPAGDGGCGLPRRPCGPPRNDNGFLSFRGAERRGNPSFLRWTRARAAEVVGPYGTKRKPAATTRAALSEAESAEREAGQIQSLPDDLRVQHGAEGSEVSAKPRPCPRRGCITE